MSYLQLLYRKFALVLGRLEINRSVFFGVATQGWSAFSSPVTMLVIAHWMSGVEQGFYYTFAGILALQVLVELGLVTVIVQIASHEWAHMYIDADGVIIGSPRAISRLASLLTFSIRWYAIAGLIVTVGLSLGGYYFLIARPYTGLSWQAPWFLLCLFAGSGLVLSPAIAIIEGCNQISSVYGYRFIQGVLNSISLIFGIAMGLGLYALPLAAFARLALCFVFILWKHKAFLTQLFVSPQNNRINWRSEVWPFQWRIGVSWISGYFIFALFTPVMFFYHGAKVAGQMGMTLSLVAAIEALSLTWISARVPQFGMLIAKRDFLALDRLFWRLFRIVATITGICSFGLAGIAVTLHTINVSLSERLLSPLCIILLIVQKYVSVLIGALAMYLRAHKAEPLMISSLITGILVGISTWVLGKLFGPTGAVSGYLSVTILWALPTSYLTFKHCRKIWHSDEGLIPSPIGPNVGR